MVAHVWPTDHPASGPKIGSGSLGAGYAAGLTAWFLVSGVFVAAKFGVDEMPPWTMCFWRLTIAALILLPLAWGERGAVIAFLRGRGWQALLIGAIGLGITQGLVYSALAFTTAINAGIIFSTAPIITMVLAAVFLREVMGPWQVLGSLVAFAGIVLVAVQGSLAVLLGMKFGVGDLLVVIAALTFAGYTILLERAKFDRAAAAAAAGPADWRVPGDASGLARRNLVRPAQPPGPQGLCRAGLCRGARRRPDVPVLQLERATSLAPRKRAR